ncbi:MAG: DNA polymerase ligase N-terminal domain-containing protein, partial [Elusimicrobiota bacterium]
LNPKEKRLAIETEDHPLSYSSFEGTIAPGKYGAGEVIIWDRGKYISAENPQKQYSRGSIKFILKGIKLKGEFLLLRTEKNPGPKSKWLLIKKYDKFISYDDITKTRPSSVVSLREI